MGGRTLVRLKQTQVAATEVAERSFFHFTAHQNALQFAEAKLKNGIYAWYFAKIAVCEQKHWIVQFRQWTKHADEILVCCRIHRWQRCDTGAGLDCKVYAGNIAAACCNHCAVGACVFIHRAAGNASISSTSSTMLKLLMSAGADGRPWRSTNERLA